MTTLHCRMKSYIQPFERQLALRELQAIAGDMPSPVGEQMGAVDFTVSTRASQSTLASRLAYWEIVGNKSLEKPTLQSLREATVNVVRNGIDIGELRNLLPFNGAVPFPNRRCLRYGTHGIHEYRGKFFPQLVRSLINIAGVNPRGIIADPMSGSGTTPVEAMLQGCHGLGVDMNPLSTFLARTKCRLLTVKPDTLSRHYMRVRQQLLATEAGRQASLPYLESLPESDQQYLANWFSEDVLAGLDEIASVIETVKDEPVRDFMRISLSNILRGVSWQKDDDLRVRKEVRLDVEIDPKREFLEELGRSVRAVLAFLYQAAANPLGTFSIDGGDAKELPIIWRKHLGKVDAVITSPPYATALPYLDTDRLSLCYLGLLSRPEHRVHDQNMIGNREVTERMRRDLWASFERGRGRLPASVQELICQIHDRNAKADVGFRRRNLPALLTKYFFDMSEVLRGIKESLKPGGWAFLVVGNNHTIAGGQHVDIQTARLLGDIAEEMGFDLSESLPMEMLVSRDIFRRNAMPSEEILVFRKPRC
jgi:hypothetical protein